jgi:putative SOS response-associated peptidase YedK
MCGRFKLGRSDKARLAAQFGVREIDIPDYPDEINNSPGSWRSAVDLENGERMWTGMRWGFDMVIHGRKKTVFNIKAETVLESRLWKKTFSETRCIVPASAFIEWKKINGKTGPRFDITVADSKRTILCRRTLPPRGAS